ncbi:hypothetical protein RB195_020252 [Necator americanus]
MYCGKADLLSTEPGEQQQFTTSGDVFVMATQIDCENDMGNSPATIKVRQKICRHLAIIAAMKLLLFPLIGLVADGHGTQWKSVADQLSTVVAEATAVTLIHKENA